MKTGSEPCLSLVSIKPIKTTTTTNFEAKTERLVRRMTAQANNRFVFCVVVVKFAVNGNQALLFERGMLELTL